jgi:hypothetical protein
MKISKSNHLSRFGCKRKLSVPVRKKTIQYPSKHCLILVTYVIRLWDSQGSFNSFTRVSKQF